jgi:hypothetical protein
MTEYTPETLRKGLPMPIGPQPDEQLWLDAHADAWKECEAERDALILALTKAEALLKESNMFLRGAAEAGNMTQRLMLDANERFLARRKIEESR